MNKNDETFEIDEKILRHAKQITLAELLDSPFTQPWTVSLLSNALNNSDHFEMENESDELLEFRLNKLSRMLKNEERQALFHLCHDLILKRQNNKRDLQTASETPSEQKAS